MFQFPGFAFGRPENAFKNKGLEKAGDDAATVRVYCLRNATALLFTEQL